MEITIKIKHVIEDNCIKGAHVVEGGLEELESALAELFSGSEKPSVKIVDEVFELLDYTKKTVCASIECMLNDIRNEKSFLFNELSKIFTEEDMTARKVNMARMLIEIFIDYVFNDEHKYMNSSEFKRFASFYYTYPYYYFKYSLPVAIADKIDGGFHTAYIWNVNLDEMATKELVLFVIPAYYRELGASDREDLRNNAEVMDMLSVSWFENSRCGSLD